jgi:hypothetical protein
MPKEPQTLRIDYAKEDINYFNGFQNAVKLINNSIQLLNKATEEVPDEHLRSTVEAWSKAMYKDMNAFRDGMFQDLMKTYGGALKQVPILLEGTQGKSG